MRLLASFACITLLATSLLLTACGFQLRGSYALPFDSIYIALPETGEMYAQLKRSIMAGSTVSVVSEQKDGQVTLQILGDQQVKDILSLSAAGRAREYQLVRTLTFRVVDSKGHEWVPQGHIVARRDISFNDDLVLSKESEEALLWRDIQNDLVQQLLRRLSAARVPTVKPVADTSIAAGKEKP